MMKVTYVYNDEEKKFRYITDNERRAYEFKKSCNDRADCSVYSGSMDMLTYEALRDQTKSESWDSVTTGS